MNEDVLERNMEYFEAIMQAAMRLRDVLQNDVHELDEQSPFRFMATAPIYFSWILDDLIAIFMMSSIPKGVSNLRQHIKATRMLLCILEESSLHGRIAKDTVASLMPDDAEDDEE